MNGRFIQKRCPKCGGNIYLEKDQSIWYQQCLQCGYTSDLKSIMRIRDMVGKGSLGQTEESGKLAQGETVGLMWTGLPKGGFSQGA